MAGRMGWRIQPLPMKLLLPASLLLVFVGVYRCSRELTPPKGPGSLTVRRATVDLPDSLSAMSPDSLSALTTRLFARGLREASDATVSLVEDPAARAVIQLRLRDGPGGRVELSAAASSPATRRRIAAAAAVDSLYRLRELAGEVAVRIADQLAPPVGEREDAPGQAGKVRSDNGPDHASPETR